MAVSFLIRRETALSTSHSLQLSLDYDDWVRLLLIVFDYKHGIDTIMIFPFLSLLIRVQPTVKNKPFYIVILNFHLWVIFFRNSLILSEPEGACAQGHFVDLGRTQVYMGRTRGAANQQVQC